MEHPRGEAINCETKLSVCYVLLFKLHDMFSTTEVSSLSLRPGRRRYFDTPGNPSNPVLYFVTNFQHVSFIKATLGLVNQVLSNEPSEAEEQRFSQVLRFQV